MSEEEIATFRLLCATLPFEELPLPYDLALVSGRVYKVSSPVSEAELYALSDEYLALSMPNRLQYGLLTDDFGAYTPPHQRCLTRLHSLCKHLPNEMFGEGEVLRWYTKHAPGVP